MTTKQTEKGSTLIETTQRDIVGKVVRAETTVTVGKSDRLLIRSSGCSSLLYKLPVLALICCLFVSCSNPKPPEQTVIFVRIPPLYDEKLSQEENYWRFQRFLFPQQEMPNPIPKGLPHDHSLLFVSIDEASKVTLNSESQGNIADTKSLMTRLSRIFHEREKAGVYEPENWKIVKAVGIKTAHSIKYGDFIKVAAAVEQSGAEPIVLLFDDDARPKFKTNLETEK